MFFAILSRNQAIPAVLKQLAVEAEPSVYTWLSRVVWRVGTDEQWKTFMGYPKGSELVIVSWNISALLPRVTNARQPSVTVITQPAILKQLAIIRLERLNEQGKPQETSEFQLTRTPKDPKRQRRWIKESGRVDLYFDSGSKKLKPGRYRAILLNKDSSWCSLPLLIKVSP